jgi:hypothetical protein
VFSARRILILSARISLFLLLMAAVPLSAQEVEKKPHKSATGAVLRSMVVPGWGQLYNESYVKALAFAAVEGTLIYSASHQSDQMKRFETANDFRREKFYRNSRNKLLWWLAGTVLLSMGDAYVDAQLYGLDVSPDISLKNETVGITVTCNF